MRMRAATALVVVFLVTQFPRLSYPVFTIDAAAKSLQALRDAINFVLAYFRDLFEAEYADLVERLFYGRSDAFDALQPSFSSSALLSRRFWSRAIRAHHLRLRPGATRHPDSK